MRPIKCPMCGLLFEGTNRGHVCEALDEEYVIADEMAKRRPNLNLEPHPILIEAQVKQVAPIVERTEHNTQTDL